VSSEKRSFVLIEGLFSIRSLSSLMAEHLCGITCPLRSTAESGHEAAPES
jgi:hypothetical protein